MEVAQEQPSQPIGHDDENEVVTESASFVHGDPPQDGNGPPKVDYEVEILQEKVTKQIIKEGNGQKPSKYSTCFGIAAMLLVIVWRPQISFLSISALLRVIVLAEAICAASCMTVYIGYLHQYNSLDSQPDILKSLYSQIQE